MPDPGIHHLLLYDYVPDMVERRGPHREAHLDRVASEREAGRLTLAGAFDPPSGAVLVFKGVTRDHVEAFVAADPYNQAGLIAAWRIEVWKLV